MPALIRLIAMTVALACSAAVLAQRVVPPLPAPLAAAAAIDVLPADPARFVFRDGLNTPTAPGGFVVAGDLGGKPVYRATNRKGAVNFYGISARWPTAKPIAKGDVLLVRFAARAIVARQESGEAEGFFAFEPAGGGERGGSQSLSVGPEWTFINVPMTATRAYAPGEATAAIFFGHLDQVFEITGFEILNFGRRVAVADLPVTKFTYGGREADAPWRAAALKRIDEVRTAPLTIRVVDARGRPVAGAKVAAAMTRSAFLWGSAISAERIVAKGPDADRYRREVTTLFDTVVFDNGLKWPSWTRPGGRATALAALDWLTAQKLRVKGHNLAWTGWKFSPKDLPRDATTAGLVEAHIRDITAATKGRLIGWDVVNEPVHETDYFTVMPRERVAEWFKIAAASDPKLELTLNEYGMLNRSSSPLMIADLKAFAAMLRANGARVDVLGVQGHVGQTPRPPTAILTDLDLLAAGGDTVQITEFDFNTTDEALQADYTRDFLIALYSHPAATGFLQWGFWEKAHWKPAAAMFRADWSEKPSLQVWRDLVLDKWKTRVTATTGPDGTIAGRGHFGRYRVTVTAGGKTRTLDYDLAKGASELVVRLG